jgi:transcriptional regulator
MFRPELKRGSMEMLILATLEDQDRHGYEIGKLIESRTDGQLEFLVSSLYSVLYRMEHKGWIKGRWVEKKGKRRRCYYSLTVEGEKVLSRQRQEWEAFTLAVKYAMGESNA